MKKLILTILIIPQILFSYDRVSEIFLVVVKEQKQEYNYIYSDILSAVKLQNTKNISSTLNNSPSIILRENTQNFGLTLPSIRGFSSNQTAVVYDGVKLPKDITSTYDLSILPTSNINNIYLLPGGWSAVFGSNAEGGVIAIKTIDLKKDENIIDFTSSYGSYDKKHYILTSGVSKKNITLLTTLENYSSDGFQENSYARKNSLTSKLTYDFANYGKTTLNIFGVNLKRGLPSGTPIDIKDFNGEKEKKANRLTDWQRDENLFLNIKHNFNINEFENDFSYSRNNLTREAYQFSSLTKIKTYSDNFIFSTKINGITAGVEVEKLTLRSNDYGNHEIKNTGYFASKNFNLTERLNSSVYLRYDDNKNYQNFLSPKLISYYKIDEKTRISYSVGRAFRAPNFADIYGSPSYLYDPNPNIKPEKSLSNEIGFEYKDKITLYISAYYYDIDDKITIYFDPNTQRSKSVNLAKGYNKGIEINTSYPLSGNFEITLSGTIIDAKGKNKDEGSYKRLAYTPQYKISSILSADIYGFKSSLKTISVGKQYSGINMTGKIIPSYTVSSLSISRKIENLNIEFTMENIFNKRYATTADIFNGYYPANPRNYSLSLSLTF